MANVITTVLRMDAKQVKTGLQSVKADVAQAEGLTGKLKAGWQGVVSSFAASPVAVGAAGAAIAGFAAKAIGDASDLEESINAVNVSFGNAADGVLALSENSAKAVGLSSADFNSLAVQLSGFASQLDTPGGPAATIDDLTKRIADFASVMNLDLAEAAQVFQSSLAGESEPIRKFGINLSAAAVEQEALSSGLADSKGEITESIKVQARYNLLMKETAKVAGDFANTADGLANQQRVLAANVEDLSAAFGQSLVPIVADAAGIINNLVASYEDLNRIGGEVAPQGSGGPFSRFFDVQKSGIVPLKGLAGALDGIERATGKLDSMLGSAKGNAGAFNLVISQMITSVEPAADAIGTGGSGDTLVGALVKFGQEAGEASDAAREFGDALEDALAKKAEEAADRFGEAIDRALQKVTDAFDRVNTHLRQQDLLADIADGWDDIAEASDEAAKGGEDDQRNLERQVRNQRRAVLDLLGTINNLPANKVIELTTQIEQAGVFELAAIVDQLSGGIVVPVSFQPQAGFSGVNGTFSPTQASPIINGINPPPAGNVTNIYPVGTTPTSAQQDLTTFYRRNGIRIS